MTAGGLSLGQASGTRGTAPRHSLRKQVSSLAIYAVLIVLGLIFTLPLLWMVTTSLKEQGQVFQVPPVWIPDPVRWDNYAEATHRAGARNRFAQPRRRLWVLGTGPRMTAWGAMAGSRRVTARRSSPSGGRRALY